MIVADLRYALRSLSRARGFTLAVVLTLGLGIGANTAIFSVVRAVMLKPLPHKDGDRLVYLRQSVDGAGGENVAFSVPEILDFRTAASTLGGIAEYSPVTMTIQGQDDAARINLGLVTGNYFSVMGLGAELGRLTTAADDGNAVPPVMVLTHDYWMRKFLGDRAIIGKKVRVGGRDVEIIGVVQPAPYFPQRMDALMNMVISEHHTSALMENGRTHRMSEMIARLAPGASVEQARAEIATIRANVQAEFPASYDSASHYRVALTPFKEVLGQQAKTTLWILMGAAAFVLVIACANVANLTLMRGVRREQELVIRAALGAGSAALRRLLLVENLMLALTGSVLGLAVAFGGVGMLKALAARYSTRADEIRVDSSVLGFALLLAVVVAVILSYAPRFVKETGLGAWLAGAGKSSANRRRQGLQRALVVAQVAVSVVLLTGAGLLTRTLQRLTAVDTGLNAEAEQVVTMEVPVDNGFTRSATEQVQIYQRVRDQLIALPGVTDVGFGSVIPLRNSDGFQLDVKAEGRDQSPGEAQPRAEYRTASTDYFRAAGIPLVKGRWFETTDITESAPVVIINQTMAAQMFPGVDAVGRHIAWTGELLKFIGMPENTWRTVVGVVGDTKDNGLSGENRAVVFTPQSQSIFPGGGVVIRARNNAEAMIPAAARAVRGVIPADAPIERAMTVAQIKDESIAPQRLNALLIGSFSLLAVFIAAVGIAGVLAFSVSARTNEIGIRMSLGASGGMVQTMVLKEGGVLLAIGLVIGAGGALFATQMIRGLLFGVAPHDPVTLVGVTLAMAAVGVGACWLPALRAAKIDPAVAIRAQ